MDMLAKTPTTNDTTNPPKRSKFIATAQMLIFSTIGIVMFFVPFEWAGKKTIAFDHLASYLVKEQRALAVVLLFGLIIYGTLRPFITGQWRATWTNRILSTFKVFGLIIALLYVPIPPLMC